METKDWSTRRDYAGSLHIVPNDDLQDHPLSWKCECRPAFVFVNDGYNEWAIVFEHEAFDKREE